MKRKIAIAAGILVTAVSTISGSYAYYQGSVTVTNHISTGDVNIGIQEYEKDGDTEKVYAGPKEGIVLPSQTISKIPRITNYAETCYIRVKTTYSGEASDSVSNVDTEKPEEDSKTDADPNETPEATEETAQETTENAETEVTPAPEEPEKPEITPEPTETPSVDQDKETPAEYVLSDEELDGISDEWVKQGEYYYYTQPLKNGESADFFQNVTIPAAWTSKAQDRVLGLTVTAEAVQAANFTPDFNSESPWGDTEIEQCVHETDNSITEVTKQYTAMSVTYEGAARKLVAAPEDFFRNLQTAMPGDTISDSFQLSNTTATSAEFFFHTETPGNLTDEELDLLKQFKLTIIQNGKTLYDGDLQAASLNQEISLGTLETGKNSRVQFTLQLPAELKNAYAKRESMVNWIFRVQGAEEPGKNEPSPAISQTTAPKTGLADPYVFVPLGIAAVTALGTVKLSRKEKKERRKKL